MKCKIFVMLSLCCHACVSGQEIQDSLLFNPAVRFRPRQVWAPAALVVSGVVTTTLFKEQIKYNIVSARNRYLGDFHTSVDNYLQYAPVPLAYALDFAGIPSRNDIGNRSLILLKGEMLMLVSVNMLKYSTSEERPDRGNAYSFPSGHTAQAFAAATFLAEEYQDRLPWMPYLAYGMAGMTGLLRIANNRHYLGDVLMGAGIGILSMKVSYWTHQYRWSRKNRRKHAAPL